MFAPGNDARGWLQGWYPQWRAAYREASRQPPRESWFDRCNAPLLDLQGAQDPWRPPATRGELADALGAKATVREIADAGHALVPEQPQAIARAIADWVRRLDNPA
jgi:pimeloyl-ACP methyl ester carboxylesterase